VGGSESRGATGGRRASVLAWSSAALGIVLVSCGAVLAATAGGGS
jgi:hypothetical protein